MLIRIGQRIKLDSNYKLGLDLRQGKLSKQLIKGRFYSPMARACLNKGGMGDLRFYQQQPHETWSPK